MTVAPGDGSAEEAIPSKKGNQQQTAANPIARKISKILESKIETDKESLDALETLSEFYTDNTQNSRRNLRKDIESRSLVINQQFLQHFKIVKEKADRVHSTVSGMNKCCQDMTTRLQACKEQTRDLINQTTKLQSESKSVDRKLQIAEAFLKAFQLRPAEVEALKETPDGGISPKYFAALSRVTQIHSDCKLLMRSSQQKAGLEIMEQSASKMEEAYETLYRWIQRECRLLNIDTMEINPLLCEAMLALQERQVLFKYALDEFSTARRNNIVRSFIDALTRGGPGGVPKPVELISHDPLRYVGDMLAWIHQSIATEYDHLHALLKMCPQAVRYDHIPQALAHITEGLCRPFKVRVEQVLTGDNGPVVLYKLANMFKFYVDTISTKMACGGPLVDAILELRGLTHSLFYSSLTNNVARFLDRIEPPDENLAPVASLHQTMLLLRDVLESHDATLIPVEDKQENFTKIFGTVIDPLLQAILLSVTQLPPVDLAVYMLNSLHTIHSTLALYEFTDHRLEMLDAQITAQTDVVVSEQAGYVFQRTGMSQAYNLVAQHQPKQGPLASVPGADEESLKAALDKFDLFLSSPDSYKLPQFHKIVSTRLRDDTNKRTNEMLASAYGLIYAKVEDPANGYGKAPGEILSKTKEDIDKLLN